MSANTAAPSFHVLLPVRAALPGWLRRNRLLVFAGLLCLLLVGVAGAGLLLDPRLINGAPAWAKPFKFSISIAIYCLTLAWLLGFVQGHPRLVGAIAGVTTAGLVGELGIILVQVVRGTTSHFNISTPLDLALWSSMGLLIIPVSLMCLLAGILLFFQRLPDPAFAWSLRLGVLVTFVGLSVGYLMTGQTSPGQQAARDAGGPALSMGAHSVGVDDGGPGLPLLGWSTVAGDLRVGHFAGLHALQILPLLGFGLARLGGRRLTSGHRLALVWIGGLGYLGLVIGLVWQALRGQSVIAPDGLTLAAGGALLAVVAGATALVLLHARRT